MPTVKVFRYIPEVDGFDVTAEYRAIADDLGLSEWNPVVWIGRLFTMDNDVGEHWFDNWDARSERFAVADQHGLNCDNLLFIDPERHQDGRDGPCHSPQFRKRFWTSVLKTLELELDLLFDEARAFNAAAKRAFDESPMDVDAQQDYRPDLEERISSWIQRYADE